MSCLDGSRRATKYVCTDSDKENCCLIGCILREAASYQAFPEIQLITPTFLLATEIRGARTFWLKSRTQSPGKGMTRPRCKYAVKRSLGTTWRESGMVVLERSATCILQRLQETFFGSMPAMKLGIR
jgi:hypothetical protein